MIPIDPEQEEDDQLNLDEREDRAAAAGGDVDPKNDPRSREFGLYYREVIVPVL